MFNGAIVTHMDPEFLSVINSLRKKRGETAALLQKYDDIIASVIELDRLSYPGAVGELYNDTLKRLEGIGHAEDSLAPSEAPPTYARVLVSDHHHLYWKRTSVSVLSKVKSLLDEAPRAWTAAEIIEQYDQRGDPVQAADPANAIRTSFSTLLKKGEVVKVKEGVYRSAKFVDKTDDRPGFVSDEQIARDRDDHWQRLVEAGTTA